MRLRLNQPAVSLSLSILAAALSAGFFFSPSAQAQSGSTEQYLSLRRLNPPAAGLTLERISDSPNACRGKTLEVQGRLAGLFPGGDGTNIVLQTDNGPVLTLTMSQMPTWVSLDAQLRVLVVVPDDHEGGTAVQIGLPALQVIAVTSASDISAAEFKWQQESAQRAEKRRREDAALGAANAALTTVAAPTRSSSRSSVTATAARRRSDSSLASRGGFSRTGSLFNYLSVSAKQSYPAYVSFVERWNPHLTDQQADAIAASILEYSERFDVDPRLVVSMIIAESDFHPGETSNKGAMGLVQLMPDEVRSLGLSNPYDPVQNIAGAVYLLRGRLDKYSGGASLTMQHIILALASYNAGMGAVKKYGGVPPYRETQNYVKKIERIYRHLCGQDT